MNTSGTFCRMCGTKLQMRELEHEGIVPYCRHVKRTGILNIMLQSA